MWFAILEASSDVDSMIWILHGSLESMADTILEQCMYSNPDGSGTLDFDRIDADGFVYDNDDYQKLMSSTSITPDLLEGFYFSLSDVEISLYCLSKEYEAFKRAFEQRCGSSRRLKDLKLPEAAPSVMCTQLL